MFPDLPTVAEAGLPGYESVLHYGIVAPAGTPRPIVDRLNAALRDALQAPDTQARMAVDGTEPLISHARTSTPPTSTAKRPSGRPIVREIGREGGVKQRELSCAGLTRASFPDFWL